MAVTAAPSLTTELDVLSQHRMQQDGRASVVGSQFFAGLSGTGWMPWKGLTCLACAQQLYAHC